jgi:glycine cleavage system H protein
MKVVAGLFYSKDHEWVKVEGDKAYIGITDFAQHSLGNIVYVELPEIDSELSVGDTFGVVESVKAASDSYSPVSGKVVEANEAVADDPTLLNSDCYENWIMAVELSDKSELEGLMSAEQYEKFLVEEV